MDQEPEGLRGLRSGAGRAALLSGDPQESPHPRLSNFHDALTFLGSRTLLNVQSQRHHWLSIAILSYSHLPLLRLPVPFSEWGSWWLPWTHPENPGQPSHSKVYRVPTCIPFGPIRWHMVPGVQKWTSWRGGEGGGGINLPTVVMFDK